MIELFYCDTETLQGNPRGKYYILLIFWLTFISGIWNSSVVCLAYHENGLSAFNNGYFNGQVRTENFSYKKHLWNNPLDKNAKNSRHSCHQHGLIKWGNKRMPLKETAKLKWIITMPMVSSKWRRSFYLQRKCLRDSLCLDMLDWKLVWLRAHNGKWVVKRV